VAVAAVEVIISKKTPGAPRAVTKMASAIAMVTVAHIKCRSGPHSRAGVAKLHRRPHSQRPAAQPAAEGVTPVETVAKRKGQDPLLTERT
jgi:hypothetical protein